MTKMETECRKLFSSIVSGFSVVAKSRAVLIPDSSLETCFSLRAVSVFVSGTLNIGSDVFGLGLFASLGLVLGLFPSGHFQSAEFCDPFSDLLLCILFVFCISNFCPDVKLLTLVF